MNQGAQNCNCDIVLPENSYIKGLPINQEYTVGDFGIISGALGRGVGKLLCQEYSICFHGPDTKGRYDVWVLTT